MAVKAKTSDADHLFDNNNNAQLLNEDTKKYFHTMISKWLFLSKRAKP